VLGDPTDPQAPARIRAFVDRALPLTRPQVGAQLLVQLADLVELKVDLRAWGRDQVLSRAVAAIRLNRWEVWIPGLAARLTVTGYIRAWVRCLSLS
jgi:hypothetical protein